MYERPSVINLTAADRAAMGDNGHDTPLIAAVTRSPDEGKGGTIITCHQTFLQMDGSEKAPVEKPKLFPSGVDPAGAAVWFGSPDPDHEFVVAEGIESALSAMRILGVAAGCAALSTWGIRCLASALGHPAGDGLRRQRRAATGRRRGQ